jgi:hypothetical protein
LKWYNQLIFKFLKSSPFGEDLRGASFGEDLRGASFEEDLGGLPLKRI